MENQENEFNWEWSNTSQEQPINWDNQENQNNEWDNVEGDNQDFNLDNQITWDQPNQEAVDNQEINTLNWEDKNDLSEQQVVEKPSTTSPLVDNNPFMDNSSEFEDGIKFIGRSNELYYHGDLFDLEINNSEILKNINDLNLKTANDDGRYEFNPSKDNELGKLIHILVKIGMTKNIKITDSSIIKTKSNESFLNINLAKPQFNFIYFAQSNETSGNIIIDFSSIGGPSYSIIKPRQGQLLIIPGWIPYRISKNKSKDDNILITGMFN